MAPTRQCERCREWVSLHLDAELSEFEEAVLRRHLRACAECRSFAQDVRGATALLRSARLADVRPRVPVSVPVRRRRHAGALRGISFGAAAAAASIVAVFASGVPGDQRSDSATAVKLAGAGNPDLASLRALRRAELHMPSATLETLRIRVIELD